MRYFVIAAIAIFGLLAVMDFVKGNPYLDSGDDLGYPVLGNDISDMLSQPDRIDAEKRACIRRGGNCDQRPNDCCHNSSCRCNLWGSNCRCQRMGLFQKWG